MFTEIIVPILAFGTLAAVVIFAYVSSQRTEQRRQSNTRPSTLAADAPNSTPPGVKPPDT